MTNPHRITIGPADARIALARWGQENSHKPPALLLHGTGFVAEVWDDVARELASDYTVYALDRRGHGDSHKPPPTAIISRILPRMSAAWSRRST